MNAKPRKRRAHFRGGIPADPRVQFFDDWLPTNRGFYASFRAWLVDSGYGASALSLYSVAARHALGFLQKPYWVLDPDRDIQSVLDFLQTRPLAPSTLETYRKGLLKLGDYLRLRLKKPSVEKALHWEYYLQGLPDWLENGLRDYLACCRAKWPAERRYESSLNLLGHLTLVFRWMAAHAPLSSAVELTPALWYSYLDKRLLDKISVITLNNELSNLQEFIRFLESSGNTICQRVLLDEHLKEGPHLPKDAFLRQLKKVFAAIEAETHSPQGLCRRCALMDRSWFLLMLHSGLRSGEVRRLRWTDLDLERKQIRIEQSKGLKDRIVFLSSAAIAALEAYRVVRGPADCLPEQVFIFRHGPLSISYAYERLRHYGSVCGVTLMPHQLRHSCATLLLNAGAPVVSVQALLGHKNIDTTLGYARLYDGTLAADFYRAMNEVERQLDLVEKQPKTMPSPGELIALLDSLRSGTLNENQSVTVQAIRDGILALARNEQKQISMEDVKVLAPAG